MSNHDSEIAALTDAIGASDFNICCRGLHEQRGRLLEALASCFSKEQWFRL